MGDKVKHKHSLLHMCFQTHAFLTIIHPLDFSDFALGDVLDDILGPVTGIGQGLWCLDFFNFGTSHGERNLGHRSCCSAHWRECRACGDGNKKEGDGEGTHCWLVVRDEECTGRVVGSGQVKVPRYMYVAAEQQQPKSNFNNAL